MKTILAILILTFSPLAMATLSIPGSLSPGEQQLILQTLGFGSSFRPVDNPYPLGGYSGVEFGISGQSIPTGDVGYLGSHAAVNNYTIYPLLSFGKGIFDNIDFLFSFVPFNETTGIGIYSRGRCQKHQSSSRFVAGLSGAEKHYSRRKTARIGGCRRHYRCGNLLGVGGSLSGCRLSRKRDSGDASGD